MITGSDFAKEFGPKGPAAWESAALEVARRDGLTPWPWSTVNLTDDAGNMAQLRVQNDFLSIGPTTDFFRLPMMPNMAQAIWNLFGYLMPTPWLVFQIYQQAKLKLDPIAMAPNLGANMAQFVAHSGRVQEQINASGLFQPSISGAKKHVVISNIWQPGKVIIFGWYRPEPNVWTNHLTMGDPLRQPIQPNSNAHGDFYVDYSHGIQAVDSSCVVNGKSMATEDLYRHPTLSKLVSNEGPLKMVRYPAVVPSPPKPIVPVVSAAATAKESRTLWISPNVPGLASQGAQNVQKG